MSFSLKKSTKKRILILTATPDNLSSLQVELEAKEIKKSLVYTSNLDKLEIIQEHAVTIDDLNQLIQDFKPNIVHFSGHGSKSGIYLENKNKQSKIVKAGSLARLFNYYSSTVECVILNSCYSDNQARAIAQSIQYVIGTRAEIKDDKAIEFSKSFYGGILSTNSYEESFELGLIKLSLDNSDLKKNLIFYFNGDEVKYITQKRKIAHFKNRQIEPEPGMSKKVQQITAFIFGILFIITLISLAILLPEPTSFQYTVFRVVLSLAAAGCTAMIPGFIQVDISNSIRAGGALAIFITVYFYNPATSLIQNLSNANVMLKVPRVVDFRTKEKNNKQADLVLTSPFLYENIKEPSKTAKIDLETANFF